MGDESDAPDPTGRLSLKPGRDWTRVEVDQMVHSLNKPEQLRRFLLIAARILGPRANREDVEDVWQDFFTPRLVEHRGRPATVTSPMDDVIQSYRPDGRAFASYFTLCFRRDCLRIRKRLAQHAGLQQNIPFDDSLAHTAVQFVVDGYSDALVWDLKEAAERCINALTARSRTALVLSLDRCPELQIAECLGISEGALRVLRHHARQRVRACLIAKGMLEHRKLIPAAKESNV